MKSKFLTICVSLAVTGTLIASRQYITKAAAVSYNGTSIDTNLNGTSTPDHIALSWTGDPTTTETITWRTITTDVKSKVQYRVKGTTAWTTSPEVMPKLFKSTTGDATVTTGTDNIFSTVITGLTPGTTYEYEVIGVDGSANEITSGISYFTTEKANNTTTKFLLFGDSQSGNAAGAEYTPWHNTIQEAYDQNKDANFFINMGDLVEIGQNYRDWNNWYSAAQGVIDNIPAMPVQGNHETYQDSTEDTSALPQDFVNQFALPQNGPYGHVGQTYSYNYGNVHFVVLDSQEDEEAPGDDSFLQQQAAWLDKDLSNNKQKWTIVMFHKTPYYNKATRNNPAVKDIFTPIIEKHHVDIVFNGHDHGLSRTYAINGNNYYTDFSKGTVYYVTGRSGNKYYTDLNSKVWDASFTDCQDSPCYEVVTVVNGKLTIDAYKYNIIDTTSTNKNCKLYSTPIKVDSLTIDKDNPSNSTKMTLPAYSNTELSIAGTLQKSYNVTVANTKAYLDPKLIAAYYKGTYDGKSLTLTVNSKAYKFNQGDLLKGDSSKVSIDALYKQGIDVSYNAGINCVLVDFTGRITSDMIAAFKGFTIGSADNTASQTNSNTSGLNTLPHTGSVFDIVTLSAVGLLLIIAGGIVIVINRKKVKV